MKTFAQHWEEMPPLAPMNSEEQAQVWFLTGLAEAGKRQAVLSNSTDWLNAQCCMTCKHWADENEREKQIKAYKANPKCMDKQAGWPCAADCNNTVANGIELYIDGNATANLEYDANFGCNNWESI